MNKVGEIVVVEIADGVSVNVTVPRFTKARAYAREINRIQFEENRRRKLPEFAYLRLEEEEKKPGAAQADEAADEATELRWMNSTEFDDSVSALFDKMAAELHISEDDVSLVLNERLELMAPHKITNRLLLGEEAKNE